MMHIAVFAGTRPEAIKMAPVIHCLAGRPEIKVSVCASGQHREMLHQAFADFGLAPEYDLEVMAAGQSLASLSGLLFSRVDVLLDKLKPDWVLVQGDTTTVMVTALCAFYRRIRVGHVEAGLRSFNKYSPFPEEVNRKAAGLVADLHFAPTLSAKENLLAEGYPEETVLVTGNTVVDAVYWMREQCGRERPALPEALAAALEPGRLLIPLTAHRRENQDGGLEAIAGAMRQLADKYTNTLFVYPMHLSPRVREPALRLLSGHPRIILTEPLSYKSCVWLMSRAAFILTDSGGIQEEAAMLGKATLVLRETTERPEGVEKGAAKLVGTNAALIVAEAAKLIRSPRLREAMGQAGQGLYGDGDAAGHIVEALMKFTSDR